MDIRYFGEELPFLMEFVSIMAFMIFIMISGVLTGIIWPNRRFVPKTRFTATELKIVKYLKIIEVLIVMVAMSHTIKYLMGTYTYAEFAEVMIFGESALIYPYISFILMRLIMMSVIGIPAVGGNTE